MVGAFANSLRRAEHSQARHKGPLVTGTISKALLNLNATFQDNNHSDPRHNKDGKTDRFISGILRSFKKVDSKEKAQKSITPAFIKHLHTIPKRTFFQHISDLCICAFFFAYRACKYSQTTGTHRIKILTPRNVVFQQGHCIITNRENFATADIVFITFVAQKNDMYHDTVTHHATTNPELCPVHI